MNGSVSSNNPGLIRVGKSPVELGVGVKIREKDKEPEQELSLNVVQETVSSW